METATSLVTCNKLSCSVDRKWSKKLDVILEIHLLIRVAYLLTSDDYNVHVVTLYVGNSISLILFALVQFISFVLLQN